MGHQTNHPCFECSLCFRRAGLDVFAALRRRLEEESSRLERLQEETTKVITENQRIIRKMAVVQSMDKLTLSNQDK